MSIQKIKGRFYKEVANTELMTKLKNLREQKANINYDALKDEYEQNIANMEQYEKHIDAEIAELENLIK